MEAQDSAIAASAVVSTVPLPQSGSSSLLSQVSSSRPLASLPLSPALFSGAWHLPSIGCY